MGQPRGDGVALLQASIVLLILSWITFIIRIVVRVTRNALGMDDYLMTIGILLFTVTASLCIICSYLGSGQLAEDLPTADIMQGTKLFFIAEFFYASGAAAIKGSIAVTLLRIADSRRRFTYTIWAIIGATTCSAMIFIIGIANICHPITTLWGEETTGSCNLKLNSDVSFFFSAIEIITDWTLAVLPMALLWNIQMKAKVKLSLAVILGMAAFASCATIVRLRYLSLYSDPAEFMFSTGKIGLWSVIEEGIGIFAGCLPALRPLLSLSCMGHRSQNDSVDNGPISGSKYNKPRTGRHDHPRSNDLNLDTFVELGDHDGDHESQKHILKETQVTITSKASPGPGEWEKNQVLGWKHQGKGGSVESISMR